MKQERNFIYRTEMPDHMDTYHGSLDQVVVVEDRNSQ